jgi:hypothetical protein
VAVGQLVDGRVRARVASLLDLVHKPVAGGESVVLGPRTSRDDLDEIVSTLRHGADAGVHANA